MPTFAEYIPVVEAAVGAGTRRVYGTYWNRLRDRWGNRRIDEPTPSQIKHLCEQVRANVVIRRNAFFVFFIGLNMITDTMEEHALHVRGATATCTVLQIEHRVETSTDSEGHPTTRVYYDHTLDCSGAPVTQLTTRSRVVDEGEEIDVRYDTTGRVDPRPATDLDDRPGPLWPGFALFGGGILLRLLYEWNVPGFRGEGGFGLNRLRRRRYRRQSRRRE